MKKKVARTDDRLTFPRGFGTTKRQEVVSEKLLEPRGALTSLMWLFVKRAERRDDLVALETARVLEALGELQTRTGLDRTATLSALRGASAQLRGAAGMTRSEHPNPGGKAQHAERIRAKLDDYLKRSPEAESHDVAQRIEALRCSYGGKTVLGPGESAPDAAYDPEGRLLLYERAVMRVRETSSGPLDAERVMLACAKDCGVPRPSALFDGERKRMKRRAK